MRSYRLADPVNTGVVSIKYAFITEEGDEYNNFNNLTDKKPVVLQVFCYIYSNNERNEKENYLYITHDLNEAIKIATKIIVINDKVTIVDSSNLDDALYEKLKQLIIK